MSTKTLIQATLGAGLLLAGMSAQAALSTSYQFNGEGNWSLDACGSNDTPVCDISAVVPTGSTIVKAFLYSSMFSSSPIPTVNFDGTSYSGADWTNLGSNNSLTAYRTDVTSQVSLTIGGGSASAFTFSVLSEDPNTSIDGEALAIIYSNPAENTRTIAFLDGYSASGGDSTSVSFSEPLDMSDPGFEAQMSLGIGFGFQPSSQYSTVDVNGATMTTCAGGEDDGIAANGGLITMGGIGDDFSTNPDCPNAIPQVRDDDEAYNLVPFLANGDSSISIDTINPSNDDNIFFAGFNITADANITPSDVSEPGVLAIMGLGLAGIGFARRRRKAA